MATIDKHAPGSFCWFELTTTDQAAAKKFYNGIFGWEANDSPMGPDEYYTMFKLEGRDAAAAYTMRPDQRSQGIPPYWAIYIAVTSADDMAARAQQLGGTVLAPAFDVMEYGRMAVIQDPTGAVFSIWQPMKNQGTGISEVDGTVCWADLNTSDPDKAGKFYSDLFGWSVNREEHDPSGYLHIKNGETFIGGAPPASRFNPKMPPHWLLYFQTSDCDAVAAKAKTLGANIYLPPTTMEKVGRMSVMADPQGAVFSLFQPMPRK